MNTWVANGTTSCDSGSLLTNISQEQVAVQNLPPGPVHVPGALHIVDCVNEKPEVPEICCLESEKRKCSC